MTENSSLPAGTSTTASTNTSISTSVASSRDTRSRSPHKMGTSIAEAESPSRRKLHHFHCNLGDEGGYDSDGAVGPFYDAVEGEGEQDFDEDVIIPERYFHEDIGFEIFEYESIEGVGTRDNETEEVVAAEIVDDNIEAVPIKRNASTQVLESTDCHFCQLKPRTNYYCHVELEKGRRLLDGKRICGAAFCVFCREKWKLSEERLKICIDCYNSKKESSSNSTDKENDSDVVDIGDESIMGMKCNQLKDELRKRKLKVSGSKTVLQDRLKQAVKDKIAINAQNQKEKTTTKKATTKKKASVRKEFPDKAFWEPLEPIDTVVAEPTNPSFKTQTTHAPTIDQADASFVPTKHNFSETWSRPAFEGMWKEPVKTRRGNLRRNQDGLVMTHDTPRSKGCVCDEFLTKNNLSTNSTPADFVAAFLPFKKNKYSTHRKEKPSFDLFAKWTNAKANLAGAGEGGTCYHDWKPFTARELRQHFGLYIFNGLSPSP